MTQRTMVLYNDTCPICSREVAAYQRASRKHGLAIDYAGLTDGDLACFGLTRDEAAKRFHVLKDGQVVSGVPAFAVLWQELPGMGWLARLVRLPVVRTLVAALYDHVLAPALFAMHKRRERRNTVSQ